MAFDALISYSSKDKQVADATCAALESAGIRCWVAPHDVRPGREYAAEIIDAIDACRVMVLIFSANANASVQVHREIERAASKSIPIIPMRIEDVTPTRSMEYFLGQIHWLDAMTPPLAKHLLQLTETVRAILQANGAGPTTVANGPAGRFLVSDDGRAGDTSERKSTSTAKRWWRAGIGLLVLLLAVGAATIWKRSDLWERLQDRVHTQSEPPPTAKPQLTLQQQILLNIVLASRDEPLELPSKDRPIDLEILHDFIAQRGYPRDLLFWLVFDSFQLSVGGRLFGYRYGPPDDFGCNREDPKHRCFVDWVRDATLSGLTVEEKAVAMPASARATTFARLCFDQVTVREVVVKVPEGQLVGNKTDREVGPADLFASDLTCGSKDWNPEQDVGKARPDKWPLVFTRANIVVSIAPRNAYGVFEFLGGLMKMQRAELKAKAARQSLNITAYIPPGRQYALDPPSLLTVLDNPQVLKVLQNAGDDCFVETSHRNERFCVPRDAATTKRVFGFLTQLIAVTRNGN